MDNLKLPAYSFIEWIPLPHPDYLFTLVSKDAIFTGIYNNREEKRVTYTGCIDLMSGRGARIAISTGGGGMLLSNLSDVKYALIDPIRPYPTNNEQFTKLEKAALMIAQGLQANPQYSGSLDTSIAEWSIALAKAVLEEANK